MLAEPVLGLTLVLLFTNTLTNTTGFWECGDLPALSIKQQYRMSSRCLSKAVTTALQIHRRNSEIQYPSRAEVASIQLRTPILFLPSRSFLL
jgi:hypothetical protein